MQILPSFQVASLGEMAELNFLHMANKQTINARTTPPTIPNIMDNVFEEEFPVQYIM